MARPSKINAEVQAKVCEALRNGNTRADAAYYAGISPRTFYDWIRRGRSQKNGEFLQFLHAVTEAEARCAVRNVGYVQTAAKKDWKAAAWWLERRRDKAFGRKDRHEVTGKGGKPIEHDHTHDDVTGLTDEDLVARYRAKVRALEQGGG